MPKPRSPRPRNYEVGYGRPPKATRFKPGGSGNPRGRPQGSRSIAAILNDIVQQKITVTEKGKTRRIPVLEVIFRRITNDAMRGDSGAIKLMLSLVERYAEAPEATAQIRDMLAEDEAILAQYLRAPAGPTIEGAPTSANEARDDT